MALSQHGTRGLRRIAAAYAALVRVPNLFTAPPDVIAGAALAVAAGATVSTSAAAGVAVASMLLYAGGTTLNDYFDAPVDAEERPERPIPSGQVSRSVAGLIGITLLASAVGLAIAVAGMAAGIGATAVACSVILYDGVLKGGPAGFLTMGATRGLNVLLGTTATTVSVPSLPVWVFGIVLAVTAYISGVTYMAAREATNPTRRSVLVAGVGMVTAGGAVVVLLASMDFGARPLTSVVGVGLAGGFVFTTGRALGRAYRDLSPETVGPVVGTCVLALVVFDGAVAATAGVRWSLAAIVFLVPAAGFSRLFDVS